MGVRRDAFVVRWLDLMERATIGVDGDNIKMDFQEVGWTGLI
jgi:hypothetical protein